MDYAGDCGHGVPLSLDCGACGRFVDHNFPPAQGIDQTLRARGERYGSFHEHARVTQLLKSAMTEGVNWCGMDPDMKESLEMIQHKIGRILNGDPQYHDSWHDIVGYAKLVADRISPQSGAR